MLQFRTNLQRTCLFVTDEIPFQPCIHTRRNRTTSILFQLFFEWVTSDKWYFVTLRIENSSRWMEARCPRGFFCNWEDSGLNNSRFSFSFSSAGYPKIDSNAFYHRWLSVELSFSSIFWACLLREMKNRIKAKKCLKDPVSATGKNRIWIGISASSFTLYSNNRFMEVTFIYYSSKNRQLTEG